MSFPRLFRPVALHPSGLLGEREAGASTGGGRPGVSVAVRRWFSAPDGDWARPVVATVLVLLLLGVPHHRLVAWLSDAFAVEHWKEIVFAVGCVAYASVVFRRRRLTRAEYRGLLLAAPFVIAVLVRLVVGVFRSESYHLLYMGGANFAYYVPAFLLAIYLLETSPRSLARQVERTLYWLLLATTLAAVLSILDNLLHISGHFDFFGRSRVEARLDYDPDVWRSSATFQSPMVLGMIVGLGFLVSLHLFVSRLRDGLRRWGPLAALGALMVLHLVGLYLTFSRGPLVATTGGAVIIGLFGSKGGLDWRALVASWRKIALGIAGVGLLLAVVVLLLPDPLQQHLGSIFDWSGDQNNSTRLRRMAIGLEMFREAPWIGQGLGSAQGPLADYRIQELGLDRFFTNPESQLLTWAVEGGLMLLVPALLVVGFMIHTSFAMASHPGRPDLRRLGVLFLGLQGALYAEGLIMPILNGHTLQLGLWVLFGALVCFRGELDRTEAGAGTSEPGAGTGFREARP